jgi:hypothetical protein
LEDILGRTLLSEQGTVITPAQVDGSGVDRVVLVYSAAAPLKIVVAGLNLEGRSRSGMSGFSADSAERLVSSIYSEVVERIGLADGRGQDAQVDAILQARPDLVLLVGGSEKGASRSVRRLAETIGMACRILPAGEKPHVLYAGNQAAADQVRGVLEHVAPFKLAPNIRPAEDQEEMDPAVQNLTAMADELRIDQIPGLKSLASTASLPPMSSSYAFGRMIRFLSKLYEPVKGVLGVDLGGSMTTMAAARGGELALNVYPYGMGAGLQGLLQGGDFNSVMRWLPLDIPEAQVRDYLWQKSLYPAAVPDSVETLAIEQAAVRAILGRLMNKTLERWPGLGGAFEPIVASGAALTAGATPVQALMMLLDGLQPVGITTLILDQNGLTPALGALAPLSSILPVQVLESNVYQNLGTVICPVSKSKPGTPIMKVRLEYEEGEDTQVVEVRQATLISLPLRPGQAARIHIQALKPVEVDPRGKRGLGSFRIIGGALGVVIDARGRPLQLPSTPARRREVLRKWAEVLEG